MYSSHKRNPAILCRRVWKPYCFVSLLSANADLALYSQSFKETLDTRILLAGTKTRLKCYYWNESYHRLVQCFRPESPKDASWTLYREGEVGQKNKRLPDLSFPGRPCQYSPIFHSLPYWLVFNNASWTWLLGFPSPTTRIDTVSSQILLFTRRHSFGMTCVIFCPYTFF